VEHAPDTCQSEKSAAADLKMQVKRELRCAFFFVCARHVIVLLGILAAPARRGVGAASFARSGAPAVAARSGTHASASVHAPPAASAKTLACCDPPTRMSAHEGGGARAGAAAADGVAALVQLREAARQAERLGRTARAFELSGRALAAAEASQPRDSLICVLSNLVTYRFCLARQEGATPQAAWQGDEKLLSLARETLTLCDARFRAGTFFTPTPEEVAYFQALKDMPAQFYCALMYTMRAADVLTHWPPPLQRINDDAASRVRIVGGALRATLEMERRGMLDWISPRTAGQHVLTQEETQRHVTKLMFAGLAPPSFIGPCCPVRGQPHFTVRCNSCFVLPRL
jgi:hypothetical protein